MDRRIVSQAIVIATGRTHGGREAVGVIAGAIRSVVLGSARQRWCRCRLPAGPAAGGSPGGPRR
ncbi:hypothetical protein ACIRPR_32125 [Streptomyces griseoflavus]|uniref:hypothetical protein n=1 Tax=Streptomyces griseoflavus TaxID=35619 RepID=UPI00382479A9